MRETKRTFADDEGEETMVAPRFDDEETVLARPVVPFEEVGDEPAVAPVPVSTTAAPPPYSSLRVAPRRSLVAALVLISALVGSVLGVAGLYFYQNRNSADAPEQQQAEVPAAHPATETASESKGVETSVPTAVEPSAPAPAAVEPDADAEEEEEEDAAKDKDSDEADASPVAERRRVSEEREPVTTTKRGKKGARDEEIQRVRRAPRYDEDSRPVVRDEVSDDDRREARRVGVITYRPRRVRQRRDRDDSPDRLRRIFEGQP